jgi:FXSXX-COOH protein
MAAADIDFDSDLIDATELSLHDLEKLPASILTRALRDVLASDNVELSAGFSSRA